MKSPLRMVYVTNKKSRYLFQISVLVFCLSSVFSCYALSKTEVTNKLNFTATERGKATIESVYEVFKKGDFNTFKTKYVHQQLNDSVYWFHFKAPISQATSVFSYTAPYIPKAQLYIIHQDGEIESLKESSTYSVLKTGAFYYRHPTWEIPTTDTALDLFLKVDNDDSQRTRLEFFLEDKNEFLKRIQKEHLLAGGYITLLLSLVIFLLYFALLNKEYAVIFYALYVCGVIIEFLAGKSLGNQLIWSDIRFVFNNIRSSNQTLGFFNLGLFYALFYRYRSATKIHQNIFFAGSIYAFLLFLGYVVKFFIGGMESYFLFVWFTLRLAMLTFLANHIMLSFKKHIPLYLAFFFALPKISLILIPNISFKYDDPFWYRFFLDNIFFFALTLEVLVFTRYIFKDVISNQKKYVQLKELNKSLETSFQYKMLETTQKERNHVLADIHDSLGGYLAALQIRLSQDLIDKDVFQNIVNAFQKEYRSLLQNLHAPEIDVNNFANELIEYCREMNQIHDAEIVTEFNISTKKLSKEKCLNIYRILTELITNALKHSEASIIKVGVNNRNEEELEIFVKDNGKGFSKNGRNTGKSFGLNNIKSRAKNFNGTFEIESNRKYGTLAVVKMPS